MKLSNLRLGRFGTDYGRGPRMLFVFDRTRLYAAVAVRNAMRHPICAWRFLCNPLGA